MKFKKTLIGLLTISTLFLTSCGKEDTKEDNISKESEIIENLDESLNIELTQPEEHMIIFDNFSEFVPIKYDYETFLVYYPYYLFNKFDNSAVNTGSTLIKQVNYDGDILNEYIVREGLFEHSINGLFRNNDTIYLIDGHELDAIFAYNFVEDNLFEVSSDLNFEDYAIYQLFFEDDNVYATAVDNNTLLPCVIDINNSTVYNYDIETSKAYAKPVKISNNIYIDEFDYIISYNLETNEKTTIDTFVPINDYETYVLTTPFIPYNNTIIMPTFNSDRFYILDENNEFQFFSDFSDSNNYITHSIALLNDNTVLINYIDITNYSSLLVEYNIDTNKFNIIDKDYVKDGNMYKYIYQDEHYIYMYSGDINKNVPEYILVLSPSTYDLVAYIPYQEDTLYKDTMITLLPPK